MSSDPGLHIVALVPMHVHVLFLCDIHRPSAGMPSRPLEWLFPPRMAMQRACDVPCPRPRTCSCIRTPHSRPRANFLFVCGYSARFNAFHPSRVFSEVDLLEGRRCDGTLAVACFVLLRGFWCKALLSVVDLARATCAEVRSPFVSMRFGWWTCQHGKTVFSCGAAASTVIGRALRGLVVSSPWVSAMSTNVGCC